MLALKKQLSIKVLISIKNKKTDEQTLKLNGHFRNLSQGFYMVINIQHSI